MAATFYTNFPACFPDPVTTVYTGTSLTGSTSTGGTRYVYGQEREENGNKYRYCNFVIGAGAAAADGLLVYRKLDATTNNWVVTTDTAAASAPGSVVGVLVSAPATTNDCWVLVRGSKTNVKAAASSSIVATDVLVASAVTANSVERPQIAGANPTAAETRALLKRVGYAFAADSAGVVNMFIDLE